jgi:hypothetical protein
VTLPGNLGRGHTGNRTRFRSRSDESGTSRRYPRCDFAAASHLTTRVIRVARSSG